MKFHRHLHLALILLPFIGLATPSPTFAANDGSTVSLAATPSGSWQLLRDGQPFEVRGVGRLTNMDLAAACGANTIRTYNSPLEPDALADARRLMDEARAKGLAIIRGINLQRESNNFSYSNSADLQRQRDIIRASVRAYRDHPALLLWGLGNEAEGPRTKDVYPEFWRELDVLARIVKEEDPRHPVMTVIAGSGAWKIKAIHDYYPSLDILGVNTYGGAAALPARLDKAGWEKSYLLTEYGPRGHWEVPKTKWDAPIEPASEAKAANYARGYIGAKNDPKGRFLGAVCFVWASKQEITSTWYGMFLPTGEKTPAVDHISQAYQGRWPANRSPRIKSLKSPGLDRKEVPPGATFTATIEADDAENDPLTYEWKVIRESGQKWAEGAAEKVPPTIDGCIQGDATAVAAPTVTVRTPDKPAAYRLFVFVRDGRGGGATQNIPFLVVDKNAAGEN
ncbi:glycoside hydrolase family 2 TIM barrel-domain containing protein [Geminisphaera colitermitum]|uniref:glycoside hydrolase family 2 TIM barrel-domain containing protein n=1 Tax=Geminisphaera colitermitum TaxID=1148786 RepID=UPI0001964F6C|nr:glycoside hydrolase family 2 TIM barrel-domain containing protein [Geminisphaera colitermitum]